MEGFQAEGILPPPRAAGRACRVVYARPGKPLVGWILHPAVFGLCSHWQKPKGDVPGRTIMCAAPGKCVCETTPLPTKWHGYLGMAADSYRELVVLTLTQSAWWSLQDIAQNAGRLRGLRVKIELATAHKSSTSRIYHLDGAAPATLPQPFDIMPTLRAMYGAEAVDSFLARCNPKGEQA